MKMNSRHVSDHLVDTFVPDAALSVDSPAASQKKAAGGPIELELRHPRGTNELEGERARDTEGGDDSLDAADTGNNSDDEPLVGTGSRGLIRRGGGGRRGGTGKKKLLAARTRAGMLGFLHLQQT